MFGGALSERQFHDTRSRLAEFVAGDSGVVALEFAFVAAPFIAVLLAILQTGIVFLAEQLLESAVERAARDLMTGYVQQQAMTQSQFAAAVCNKIPGFFVCSRLSVDVSSYATLASVNTPPSSSALSLSSTLTQQPQFQPGSQGDIVVIRLTYKWPVFLGPLGFTLANLPSGDRLLVATAVLKNEPYQ